jgi:arsenite-transporting ATPase
VSTDPAHSLADALGVTLTARPRVVWPRLRAVELDAPRAFARWRTRNRQQIRDILEQGTWLDRSDVEELLVLPIPGVDELMGILEIVRLAQDGQAHDQVVVDMAPTGHALRLLSAPNTVGAVAGVLASLRREHRIVRERLVGDVPREAADRLIELLAAQAAEAARLLRDVGRTRFAWVMVPETLALAETIDGLARLDAARIPVPTVIINRVLPAAARCPLCDRRRSAERRVVALARRAVGSRRVIIVPAGPFEPRGKRALARVGAQLVEGRAPTTISSPDVRARGRADRQGRGARRSGLARMLLALESVPLVFFAGKGGVGKTTTAAASALALARHAPSSRVLLLSTDPAHSLADVFDEPLGDTERPLRNGPPNLTVRELDAAEALAARRDALDAAAQELVGGFGTVDAAHTAAGVRELIELMPPGIDELLGLVSVAQGLRRDSADRFQYDQVVVDTAPTGHALRLLELPQQSREWVHLLMRMLLKYREVVPPGRLGEELLGLSRAIGLLQSLLDDPNGARCVVVTRAGELPRLETERLLASLRRLRLAVPVVVVNAVTDRAGRCVRCAACARAERRSVSTLTRACTRRRPRRCDIIETPLVAPPPRGAAALTRWANAWIARIGT